MKKDFLLLLLIPLLLSPGCSQSPDQNLPPTLIWNKDQKQISPASGTLNIWEGFSIKKGHYEADRDISQFILWRSRKANVAVLIDYSLQGHKIQFAVNVRQQKTLAPTLGFKREKFYFSLSRGFNFLKFTKKSKHILKIRSICIDAWQEKPEPHLLAGQSFSFFHFPGRGRLELRGRGAIEIVRQQTAGEALTAKKVVLQSSLFSGKIPLDLELSSPGMFTITAKKGSFNISHFSFQGTQLPREKAKTTFRSPPNIYIVLSDACQASHLQTYGYHRKTSPGIDALAADAMVYENAYANASFTRASVATMLTGIYPDSQKAHFLLNAIPKKLLTMPEYLKARGYATAFFCSTVMLSPPFGFTQGIDDYISISAAGNPDHDDSIQKQFAKWLDKTAKPQFAYMHFIHPHLPKVPPANFEIPYSPGRKPLSQERMSALANKAKNYNQPISREELEELIFGYDSSIAWMDSEFGKIIAHLKQKNLYDESLIIFLADHGEAMMEHGVLSHSGNVYDETTRIPLIVKYPKALNLKGRVMQLSEIADIFPTIGGLFGREPKVDGSSLLERSPAHTLDDRIVISRTVNRSGVYSLRWKNWYYILGLGNNHEELFALEADPYREVGSSHPEIMAFLKARFLAWFTRFRNDSGNFLEISPKSLTASEIKDMKALGYL